MTATTLLFGVTLALGLAATPAYAHPNLGQGCRCHGGSKTPPKATTSKQSSKPSPAPVAQAPVVVPAPKPVAAPASKPVAPPEPPVALGHVDPLHGGVHFVGRQDGYGGRADR